jgi:hypothetical protein
MWPFDKGYANASLLRKRGVQYDLGELPGRVVSSRSPRIPLTFQRVEPVALPASHGEGETTWSRR